MYPFVSIVLTKHKCLKHSQSCSTSFQDTYLILLLLSWYFVSWVFKYCHYFQPSSDFIQNIIETFSFFPHRVIFLLLYGFYHQYGDISCIDNIYFLSLLTINNMTRWIYLIIFFWIYRFSVYWFLWISTLSLKCGFNISPWLTDRVESNYSNLIQQQKITLEYIIR